MKRATQEEESLVLRATESATKEILRLQSERDQLREENELLKERNAVLLQALVDYFNHSVPIEGTKALSANLAVAHLINKYSR